MSPTRPFSVHFAARPRAYAAMGGLDSRRWSCGSGQASRQDAHDVACGAGAVRAGNGATQRDGATRGDWGDALAWREVPWVPWRVGGWG